MGALQLGLFGPALSGPPAPTKEMRIDLETLEISRPLGATRVRNGWRSHVGFIRLGRHTSLIAAGLARIDYAGRNPRLKITIAGRRAIGASGPPELER